MQYSILNKSQLHQRLFRLDPEYYSNEALNYEMMLRKKAHKITSEICYVTDGEHGTVRTFKEGNVKYFGARNVLWGILEDNGVEHISDEDHLRNRRSELKAKDVLISCVGANIGHAAIVPGSIGKANIVRNVALLRSQDFEFKNGYILSYFLSKYGKTQFLRVATGNAQPLVSLDNIKEIIIPKLNIDIQILIERIVDSAESSLVESKNQFRQAQRALLSELGIRSREPKHRLTFAKNFSDTQKARRFDAEYFQPHYEKMVKTIKKYSGGWNILESCLNVKDENFTPKSNIKYKYIELANIGNHCQITGCTETEGQDLPTRARRRVNENDVIVSSIEGSLSAIALITSEYKNCLCSTGFYVVDSNMINPETLLVLLKSPVGQLQLKKACSGTILTAINRDEFNRIVLPLIQNEIQEEVQQNITESFRLREQSKRLLYIAKKAVEMAIEKSEDEAEKWLEKEMEKANA